MYWFLARERARLFPEELFADLFQATGRRSMPPSILAVVGDAARSVATGHLNLYDARTSSF